MSPPARTETVVVGGLADLDLDALDLGWFERGAVLRSPLPSRRPSGRPSERPPRGAA